LTKCIFKGITRWGKKRFWKEQCPTLCRSKGYRGGGEYLKSKGATFKPGKDFAEKCRLNAHWVRGSSLKIIRILESGGEECASPPGQSVKGSPLYRSTSCGVGGSRARNPRGTDQLQVGGRWVSLVGSKVDAGPQSGYGKNPKMGAKSNG